MTHETIKLIDELGMALIPYFYIVGGIIALITIIYAVFRKDKK